MKRKITYIIIAVAAVALAAFLISRCSHKNRKTETVYETETVTTGSIGKTITATGTVEPISKVDVGTQVSGNIAKIYVDYNSVVKKGQLIAELDRTNLRSELSMQENSLASAENEMNYQKKNYERTKQLYEQHLVSDAEYEESEYRYKTSVYTYNRAKESVATARTNLGYSYIYSPIDGVILSKSVEEGQTVAASFSTPTLFTIANLRRDV
ncbi:MAG: efflux RND transporter periplasmic adaptor subunit, partial [Bacteroidales bacterium]|nr:efflux RND transporter periplasmic adaptor subunit [Bacteroidales bacterium]